MPTLVDRERESIDMPQKKKSTPDEKEDIQKPLLVPPATPEANNGNRKGSEAKGKGF